MIDQLLQLVAEGGVLSYDELAKRLSISRPLLEMMLEDLARRGYLRAVDAGCGGHCAGCAPARSGCCGGSIAGPARLWTLTDKGANRVGA
jgi:predicted ArsR family transcriptional regulator